MSDDQFLQKQPTSTGQSSNSERLILLAKLIQESRMVRGLPPLHSSEIGAAVLSWQRALAEVPTVDLDESFSHATRGADALVPFGALHVLASYREIIRERAVAKRDARERAERYPHDGILTPEENEIEFAYWSEWLAERKARESSSGMTELAGLLRDAVKQ